MAFFTKFLVFANIDCSFTVGCPLETLLRQALPPQDELYSQFPSQKNGQSGPFFDIHRTVNVTALRGVTSHLVCRVRKLGNYTVSCSQFCKSRICATV